MFFLIELKKRRNKAALPPGGSYSIYLIHPESKHPSPLEFIPYRCRSRRGDGLLTAYHAWLPVLKIH